MQNWLHRRVSPQRAAYLCVKDGCASPTCSLLHVPSSWCLGVLPYQNPYFWSSLRCIHCNHLLCCMHAPELITPIWAAIPQSHWHWDHTALFKSHHFYAALNKCHDFYTYVWIVKGVMESSEQQNTGHEKLFADLWEFIQNCFFSSSAAKNLKALGCPAVGHCFSYWSARWGKGYSAMQESSGSWNAAREARAASCLSDPSCFLCLWIIQKAHTLQVDRGAQWTLGMHLHIGMHTCSGSAGRN